jgi:hypothetical protein
LEQPQALAGVYEDYKEGKYMGTGICGGIPLDFYFDDEWDRNKFLKNSGDEFLAFYRETETDPKTGYSSYTIDYPDLLSRFKEYYFGLHRILGNNDVLEQAASFNDDYDLIVHNNDYNAFVKHFSSGFETGYDPLIREDGFFSTLYLYPVRYLLIYNGSYKVILEEYNTLSDMEKLLIKAYEHPLAKITKFGIFG